MMKMATKTCAMAVIMVGMLMAACMAQHTADAAIVPPLSPHDVVEASASRFRHLLATPITTVKGCTCVDRWQYQGLVITGCGSPGNGTEQPWCEIDRTTCTGYRNITVVANDNETLVVGGWDRCQPGAANGTIVPLDSIDEEQTTGGCTCKKLWSFMLTNGTILSGVGCANPDHDEYGTWCIVDPNSCDKTWQEDIVDSALDNTGWDYCVSGTPSQQSFDPQATPAASRTATPAGTRTAAPTSTPKPSTIPGSNHATPVVAAPAPNSATNQLNANGANSATNPTAVPAKSAKKSDHTSAIVGAIAGVVGGLMLIGLGVAIAVFFMSRSRRAANAGSGKRMDLPEAF